ncbi:MAG: right-handed parallel beta-helix repeat-containing protein [Methanobacteriota archaeon]|nr:MAG: right-handed parallel beta-helix repeat-containing protein [Euryarchaeota archaeon]
MTKRMRISGLIAVWFFLPLAGAFLSTTPAEADQAYTPHDVIQIDGDSNFVAENGITGGQGTAEDPFMIEGWVINASLAAGSAGGIVISNTDAHFKISKVRVELGGALYDGIWLSNVRNGWIEDSVLVDNYDGITLNSTAGLTIKNNTLMNNSFSGVHAEASEYVNIELNEINGSRHGVHARYCEQFQITDNAISDNEYGVYMNCTSKSSISGNNVTRNHYGVYLTECADIDLGLNSLADNDVPVYDSGSPNGDDETDSSFIWSALIAAFAAAVIIVYVAVVILSRRGKRLG